MAELNQLIGAILRDVSQARFLSDLYSRQISFTYENDSLLRRFPVPRAEIDEVEFNLPFMVTEVKVDEHRHQSRNAAVGRLFDDYSLRIVRAGLLPVQQAFENATKGLTSADADKPKKAVADRFQNKILSDEFRVTLHGRLLRYLNENTEELLSAKEDGPFDANKALAQLSGVIDVVRKEPEVVAFESAFGPPDASPAVRLLDDAFGNAKAGVAEELKQMGTAVNQAYRRYPDYSVQVEIDPAKLQSNSAAASYIKVKAVVKNYRWSKVDVDSKDMRNLRTLVPE
jgi:hypothetical protein